jgi:hypothetical protein
MYVGVIDIDIGVIDGQAEVRDLDLRRGGAAQGACGSGQRRVVMMILASLHL